MKIEEVCRLAPVIPVLSLEDAGPAPELARALVAGGLKALEITLRTPAALEAIEAVAKAVPEAVVGAGTLLRPDDLRAARDAGARFGVSPGLTDPLLEAAEETGLPLLPGVATPSEAMRAADRGLEVLKFFPAEQSGGAAALRAWAGPLPRLQFCPTGGITPETVPAYLTLPNVICVGGSWIAPPEAIAAGDWDRIGALARQAAALAKRA